MAVSLNMSNYRADYFVGEASLSQRVEVQQSAQGSGFAQILDSRNSAASGSNDSSGNAGSVNSSGTVNSSGSVGGSDVCANTASAKLEAPVKADAGISDKLAEAVGAEFNELKKVVESEAAELPEDTLQLARDIINGDVKLEDVPAEKITYELLKALVLAKFEKKLEEDEKANDPKEKSVDQTCTSAQVDAMLAIFFALIDSYTETRYDDSGEGAGFMQQVEEISEMIDELGEDIDMTALMARLLIEKKDEEEEPVEDAEELGEVTLEEEIEPVGARVIDKLAELIGEDKAKLLQEAVESGDVTEIAKAVQKVADAIVKPEIREDTARFTVAREVSEELEMLRSAKLAQKQPDDLLKEFGVKVDENAGEVVKALGESAEANEGGKSESGAGSGDANTGANGAALTAQEAPVVFRTADGAEFEVQPSEVVSQAMKIVEQAVQDTAERTEYSLVLNPGELGRITVRMIKAADGAVSVTIAAENSHTQRILEENSSLMQSNLRNSGIQLESWQTVSESQQETLAQDYNGSSKNPYYREEQKPEETEPEESFAEIIAAM